MFKKMLLSTLAMSIFSTAFSAPVHTWHTISTTDGEWEGKLQMINQNGQFVTKDGSTISAFTIMPNRSQDYGFSFDKNADFDVAYTLTLIKKEKTLFVSKACVYIITASGPAKPDVRAMAYNDAHCDWQSVPRKGMDFFVS